MERAASQSLHNSIAAIDHLIAGQSFETDIKTIYKSEMYEI